MESPKENAVVKDFQVTGVSRSGRVRKKSSKLLDFESPETETEKKRRRRLPSGSRYQGRGRPPNVSRTQERELESSFDEQNASEPESHSLLVPSSGPLMNSDDELDTLVQDLVDGVEAEATNESRVRQSLYMREQSNTRKVFKDSKIKAQRKDKGKTRYTAYSLWARDVRKRDFHDLDFASAARRLSELWANVSNKEKNAWRRKAKMQATKARARGPTGPGLTSGPTSSPLAVNNGTADLAVAPADFINRPTTSRTRKLAAERRQQQEHLQSPNDDIKPKRNSGGGGGGGSGSGRSRGTSSGAVSPLKQSQESSAECSPSIESGSGSGSGSIKGLSIEPIDAAAHLKLLGESLTVIGERLKEHNGHVALSGSLSVLLDSLLCSMGPLLCISTKIPGLENKPELAASLAKTLDNIAYVMPGL